MIRIVKMTFEPSKVERFLKNFEENKHHIRSFKGAKYLELLNDKNNPNIFFTYSVWKSEQHLENYRNSDLFKNVWAATKPLFSKKVEAWSVENIVTLS